MKIRDPSTGSVHELAVDVRTELEAYDWLRPRWTHDKLIAASPFRYDRLPSFFVNLESGGWHDSGAVDPAYASGNFVSLLAFLRNETYEEAAEYLIATYGQAERTVHNFVKVPQLSAGRPRIIRIDERVLAPYRYRHPYLGGRGISEAVQRLMNVGYDRKRRAITLPWYNADGTLANVKYRRIDAKTFWYESGGRPIRELVYGLHIAYQRRLTRAAIVEGEVDALSLMSAGVFAVATGGASAWTAAKRDAIIRSPIEELTIYRDNDAAGKAWAERVIAELRPYVDIRLAYVPGRYKDVNEAWVAGWRPERGRTRRVWRIRQLHV